jgi:hypothetical protein
MMKFSASERAAMLELKGVGHTVIDRLEQIGISSFTALAVEDAETVTRQISLMLGSSCWGNSPLAKKAIRDTIELAKQKASEA